MTKSAAAFRRVEEIPLPSGLSVQVRRPDVARLVMESETGTVPTFLVNQVISRLVGKPVGENEEWIPKPEDLQGVNRFIDLVVRASLVWPVLSENPDYEAGQIHISDLMEDDRNTIFLWALPGGAQTVQRFRTEPNGAVGSASAV